MAIPATAAAIAIPTLGKLFSTLFGGQRKVPADQQLKMLLGNVAGIQRRQPKIDLSGIYGQQEGIIDRGTRLRSARLEDRLRRATGPRATSVLAAAAPARFALEGTGQKVAARQNLGVAKSKFDLASFGQALGASSGMLPGQIGMESMAPLGGRALAAGGGGGIDMASLLALMKVPGIAELLGIGAKPEEGATA